MKLSSSFRDPAGFLFRRDGVLLRQINLCAKEDFDAMMTSGLYNDLEDLLIRHEEVAESPESPDCYKIIRPQLVPFISYPYEWSFSQFKDAALAILRIQRAALAKEMWLKDASAYNIQFFKGRPVLIDTLSFERYSEGAPWPAYRQFCQHFLAPLALMANKDIRLAKLMQSNIDGVPLDLAAKLLPFSSRFNLGLLTHIITHAGMQSGYSASGGAPVRSARVTRNGLHGLIAHLESTVKNLSWNPAGTEWGDYYTFTNYSDEGMQSKKEITLKFLSSAGPSCVWDLGGNTGLFSRLASDKGINTVCFDVDPSAVEKNYLYVREHGETNLLPLLMDLTAPSPAIGWANDERGNLSDRGGADTVMALALVHHLAISNNLPLEKIAAYFKKLCRTLIIEFVPKEDSQVQKLLSSRKDIFPHYNKENFEKVFAQYFTLVSSEAVAGSSRTIYLYRR